MKIACGPLWLRAGGNGGLAPGGGRARLSGGVSRLAGGVRGGVARAATLAGLGGCGETPAAGDDDPGAAQGVPRLQAAHALAGSPCVAYPLSLTVSNPYPRPQGQPRPSACPPAPTPFPLVLPSSLSPPPSHPSPSRAAIARSTHSHSPPTVAPLLHRSTRPSACPASAFPFRNRRRTRLSRARTGKSRSSCDQSIHRDRWTNRPTLDLHTC